MPPGGLIDHESWGNALGEFGDVIGRPEPVRVTKVVCLVGLGRKMIRVNAELQEGRFRQAQHVSKAEQKSVQ